MLLCALVVGLVAVLGGCGGSDPAPAPRGAALGQPPGFVPIPGAGAPDTVPVDPRLASFCNQYYAFVLNVYAASGSLKANHLREAKRSMASATQTIRRVVGVAPAAIAAPVRELADHLGSENAALQATNDVANFEAAIGPLVGQVYTPYVTSFTWFSGHCKAIIFSDTSTTTPTSAPTSGPAGAAGSSTTGAVPARPDATQAAAAEAASGRP